MPETEISSPNPMPAETAAKVVPSDDRNLEGFPLCYVALIKHRYLEKQKFKTRYYVMRLPLTQEEATRYFNGEDIQAECQAKVEGLLTSKTMKAVDPISMQENIDVDMIGETLTELVEITDTVGSTPDRVIQFFKPGIEPDNAIYFGLFIGYIILAGLIALARGVARLINYRKNRQRLEAEEETTPVGMSIANSTITWNRADKIIPWPKAIQWVDVVYRFAYSYAFWYWVLWSIAALTLHIGVAVIPFGPAGLVIALFFTCLQKWGGHVFRCYFGTKASPEDKITFEVMNKIHLIEEAGKKLGIEAKPLAQHLEFLRTLETTQAEGVQAAKQLIMVPSTGTQRNRIAMITFLSFAQGFIMTTLVFFALGSVMAGAGLGGLLAPVIVSAVVAFLYGYKAYREARVNSDKVSENFGVLQRRELIDRLNTLYQKILEQRKTIEKFKSTHASVLIPSDLAKFEKFSASVDNLDFIINAQLTPRSEWGKWKAFIGEKTRLIILFVGGTESASLIFRVIFGLAASLAALGLVANPISLGAAGAIMGVIALTFGITKLLNYWAEQTMAKEKLRLDQLGVSVVSAVTEYELLNKQIQSVIPSIEKEIKEYRDNPVVIEPAPKSKMGYKPSPTSRSAAEPEEEEGEGEAGKVQP